MEEKKENNNLSDEEEKMLNLVGNNLIEFTDAFNILMLKSGGGECPQIIKMALVKVMLDNWEELAFNDSNKKNKTRYHTREDYLKSQEFVKLFLKENALIVKIKKEPKE